MYAMNYTRPGIAFSVGMLSRLISNPGKPHCVVVQRSMRYLKETLDLGLLYIGYPDVI